MELRRRLLNMLGDSGMKLLGKFKNIDIHSVDYIHLCSYEESSTGYYLLLTSITDNSTETGYHIESVRTIKPMNNLIYIGGELRDWENGVTGNNVFEFDVGSYTYSIYMKDGELGIDSKESTAPYFYISGLIYEF